MLYPLLIDIVSTSYVKHYILYIVCILYNNFIVFYYFNLFINKLLNWYAICITDVIIKHHGYVTMVAVSYVYF